MPHDFHPIKCGYANCLCISGTSLSHAMAVHASECTQCTMHKPHGRMRTLSSQCTHSDLTAPSGCIKWPKNTRSILTRPLHQIIYCAIQNTGAKWSTGDGGRVSALQGCMHMGNSYIQWFHSSIHTCMHIYVIATCKTQLQHCKLDCLLVSVCGNFFQYQFLLEPCIFQYDKAVGSHSLIPRPCEAMGSHWCPKYLTPKHAPGMHGLASSASSGFYKVAVNTSRYAQLLVSAASNLQPCPPNNTGSIQMWSATCIIHV